MGMKDTIRDYIQENSGELLEFFLDNLKIVARGDVVFDLDKKQIATEDAYLAIVDKKTGKDILKRHLPMELNLNFPSKGKLGIEYKQEFTTGTEKELNQGN